MFKQKTILTKQSNPELDRHAPAIRNSYEKSGRSRMLPLLVSILSLSFLVVAGSAFAGLTLNSTTVSSDGALNLTGAANSTWDLGAGHTLSLQTNGGRIGIGTVLPLAVGDGIGTASVEIKPTGLEAIRIIGANFPETAVAFASPTNDEIGAIYMNSGVGTGSGYSLSITGSNTGTPVILSENGGRVGIGITLPPTKLSIAETSTGTSDDIIRFMGNGNNAANTVLGAIDFFNNDGSGSGPNVPAAIKSLSYNGTGAGGQLAFFTHPQGSVEGEAAIEAMRINGDGVVGIGTTNPSTNDKLDVAGH